MLALGSLSCVFTRSRTPSHGMVLPAFKVSLPTSVKLTQKVHIGDPRGQPNLHRPSQPCPEVCPLLNDSRFGHIDNQDEPSHDLSQLGLSLL